MHLLALVLLLPPSPGDRADAMEVLRQWDAARSTAYAEADPAALARLYAPGSGAGRADRAILQRYRERDLTVWQRSQVFGAAVLVRRDGRIDLRVTDRTLTVIGDGVQCRSLPTTLPAVRDVRFTRSGGHWLVESVRPAPSAIRR